MTGHRETGYLIGTSLLAAATTWVAAWAWSSFLVVPGHYLRPLFVMGMAIALAGAALRIARMPALVTLVVQAALAVVLLCRQYAGSVAPTRENLGLVADAVDVALESARNYAAPIGTDVPSVAPLLVVGGLTLVLLVDLLACGLRRVPLAGLALLAVYSVPAGIPTANSTWLSFILATAGFLTLVHLATRREMHRWGRVLGPHDGSADLDLNPVSDALRAGAGRMGVAAIVLAMLAPLVIPVMDLDVFGFGGGSGSGSDDITIRKPVADMRRDLMRPEDRPLLNIVTDDPDPGYLRIAVLNRYTGQEWSSGDRDVDPSNRADGELPDPEGVSPSVARRTWSYDVRVSEDFDSTWLPTQFPASAVTAPGDWRFDPDAMDFLGIGGVGTAGLSYAMTGIELDYGDTDRWFGDASPSVVDEVFLDLPGQIPAAVTTWAQQVTTEAFTDYERAIMLQAWFRSSAFTYSLDRAPEGTGNETLEGFLSPQGRVGYCEQFASAMAVMARLLGIPARVAVGFLRPEQQSDGSWTYSSHDLHAWPELYFSGAGWVRFEPTPSARAATVPSYSLAPGAAGGPGQGPGAEPTSEPATPATRQPLPPDAEPTAADAGGADAEGGGGTTQTVLLVLVVVALLVLLGLAPGVARGRQREHRLHGTPDAVWDELHATALDLGIRWPEGRSPREVAAVVVEHLDDPGHAALERIVTAVEAARYARPGRDPAHGALAADARACIAAWEAAATPRTRRRARWWPASLGQRLAASTSLREPSRL